MKAMLIGSRAFREADYNDTDIIADKEWKEEWDRTYGSLEMKDEKKSAYYKSDTSAYETCEGIYEVIVPPEGSAHWELLQVSEGWNTFEETREDWRWIPKGLSLKVAPVIFLAAMKKAHLILPSSSPEKWKRHSSDYAILKKILREQQAKTTTTQAMTACGHFIYDAWHPTNYAKTFFDMHRAECLARQKKPPKLAQDKKGFFGDEPYEIFDHDSIHEALAFPLRPAYEQMKDGEVMCSKKKWDKMPEHERLRCVVEEAGILALERSILPALFLNRGYRGQRWAYEHALMKICTTITSGFFRDYCIESWTTAVERMPDLAGLFFNGIKAGIVKCKKPEVLK